MYDINSVNRIVIVGHVGQDLEVRALEGGRKVVNLNVCTNEAYMDEAGERIDREVWHRATAWGPNADRLINGGVKKGSKVRLEGRISYEPSEKEIEGVIHHFINASLQVEESINLTPKAAS
jgi:single-strand DNA-binding protein